MTGFFMLEWNGKVTAINGQPYMNKENHESGRSFK